MGSGGSGKSPSVAQPAQQVASIPEPEEWVTEYTQDADGNWVSANRLVKESEVSKYDQTLVTDYRQLPSGQWEAYTKAVLKTESDQYAAHKENQESAEEKKRRMPTLLTSGDALGDTPVEKKTILGV
jgi:hypothetical protein